MFLRVYVYLFLFFFQTVTPQNLNGSIRNDDIKLYTTFNLEVHKTSTRKWKKHEDTKTTSAQRTQEHDVRNSHNGYQTPDFLIHLLFDLRMCFFFPKFLYLSSIRNETKWNGMCINIKLWNKVTCFALLALARFYFKQTELKSLFTRKGYLILFVGIVDIKRCSRIVSARTNMEYLF